VRASHILFKTEGRDDAAVKTKAEGVLKQVKAGANFAELAKRYSEDEATANNGGDLDYFGRGRMVAEFDQAAFTMQPGQISALVKTQYGYHIIKFVDDRPLPVERADERRRYANFVRARLSFAELIILFYGGLTEQGAGMRPLIERHALLKHLQPDRLLDPEHRVAYRPAAWARPVSKHRDGPGGQSFTSSGQQG